MRKKELTPEEKKRCLELEELEREFVDKAKEIQERTAKLIKRAVAYEVVKNLSEEQVNVITRNIDE